MSDMIRVGLDVTPLLGAPTGIHQTTRGLLEALVARVDIDVGGYVLSTRGSGVTAIDVDTVHRRIPARLAHRLWAHFDHPSTKLVAGEHDVVHGTNFVVPPGPCGRVVTVHDLTPILRPGWCRAVVVEKMPALRRAVDTGAHVHVPSEAVARDARYALGVEPSRLHVIGNGIRPLGPGSAEAGRKRIAARYVVAVGATEPRKNFEILPGAVAAADDRTHLVVVGPAGDAEGALIDAAAVLGERFHRLGELTDEARSDVVRGADLLAFPSLQEGFGLPPLEALQAGVPVVSAAVGALPEMIGDLVELVQPGDDEAFRAALGAALSDPPPVPDEVRSRLDRHTWIVVADQMAQLYRQVAEER